MLLNEVVAVVVFRKGLVKISGRMKSECFGASLMQRMEQAASQIQDWRDLTLLLLFAISTQSFF